jgi:hypothetical protein
MSILNKETLIGAAALGAGAIGAKVVHKKLLHLAKVDNPMIQNAITLAGGIFIPSVAKGNIAKSFGAGMIAASVAGLIEPFLAAQGLAGDVFMGDVLMGDLITPQGGSDVNMGSSSNVFDSPSNDQTSGESGEMDF